MLNLSDESVHFGRRDCSTSAAEGVQLERYIQMNLGDNPLACSEYALNVSLITKQASPKIGEAKLYCNQKTNAVLGHNITASFSL